MTRGNWRVVASLVLLGTVGPESWGADDSLVGSRVRIRTAQQGEPRVGVLEKVTPDELLIRPRAAASPIEVRRSDILGFEVSRGSKRHTLKGLLAGAVAWGAIAGLVAAFDTLDESGVGEPLFVGGLLVAGAGVGSLIKTERWETVPAGGVSAGIGAGPRGLRAQVVFRF